MLIRCITSGNRGLCRCKAPLAAFSASSLSGWRSSGTAGEPWAHDPLPLSNHRQATCYTPPRPALWPNSVKASLTMPSVLQVCCLVKAAGRAIARKSAYSPCKTQLADAAACGLPMWKQAHSSSHKLALYCSAKADAAVRRQERGKRTASEMLEPLLDPVAELDAVLGRGGPHLELDRWAREQRGHSSDRRRRQSSGACAVPPDHEARRVRERCVNAAAASILITEAATSMTAQHVSVSRGHPPT